jgi:hypothetical protein
MNGKKEMLDVAVLRFEVDCRIWALWLGLEWDEARFNEFLRAIFEDPLLYLWFAFLNVPKTLLPKDHPLPRHSDFRERLAGLRGSHEPYRSIWEWMCSLPDLALAKQLGGDKRSLKEILEETVQLHLLKNPTATQRIVAVRKPNGVVAFVNTLFHTPEGDRRAFAFLMSDVRKGKDVHRIRNQWIEWMLTHRLTERGALPEWMEDEEGLVALRHGDGSITEIPLHWGPMFTPLLAKQLRRKTEEYSDLAYDEGKVGLRLGDQLLAYDEGRVRLGLCGQLLSYYPPKYWSLRFTDEIIAKVIREELVKFVRGDLRIVKAPGSVVSWFHRYLPKRVLQRLNRERAKLLNTLSLDEPLGGKLDDGDEEFTRHFLLGSPALHRLELGAILPVYPNKHLEYVKRHFFEPTKQIAIKMGRSESQVSKYKSLIRDDVAKILAGTEPIQKPHGSEWRWRYGKLLYEWELQQVPNLRYWKPFYAYQLPHLDIKEINRKARETTVIYSSKEMSQKELHELVPS